MPGMRGNDRGGGKPETFAKEVLLRAGSCEFAGKDFLFYSD
ncbi:Hypothetical protein CpOVI2C_00538 [Corynebacterium pseudotuberculosis]|nr:hypothetical protein CPTA_01082 [Corynebacterium pseudotuberculosis]AIG10399.1 hypothetical protein CPTC_00111 [Corynebacterium pseudotuberculosis]AQL50651.1 hypothetical protein CpPA04_0543 [Corynebacterium pseudotuberculosis]AUY06551.1 Hypothetical protein CpOVI2C_00538 [Corynebacterium pseudotuberculosis]AUY55741.1 Hypothetical protein CpCAP3W_00538 [Corynebacterium pseudotuberculosis]